VTGVDIPAKMGPRRPGDPPMLYANADKIKRELGWAASRTDIDQTVETAWRWFRNNPDGYDKTSVTESAEDLSGRLLLLHGMMDDNVHPQNSTLLIDALVRAEKQFDMFYYPGRRHGIWGGHYNRLIHDFTLKHMRPGETQEEPERARSDSESESDTDAELTPEPAPVGPGAAGRD